MTKIILAQELLEEGVSKSHIAKHLGVSRRTIIRTTRHKLLKNQPGPHRRTVGHCCPAHPPQITPNF